MLVNMRNCRSDIIRTHAFLKRAFTLICSLFFFLRSYCSGSCLVSQRKLLSFCSQLTYQFSVSMKQKPNMNFMSRSWIFLNASVASAFDSLTLFLTFFNLIPLQVCEVYKLHRETFYLAQDFFDRFMATQQNVVKTLLQLIGISSLFIAAKLEVSISSFYLKKKKVNGQRADLLCTRCILASFMELDAII